MRLILSRKGFDSSSGGCPNPIFPDGSMLALPIPDASSIVRYDEINHNGQPIGELVSQLSKGRIKATDGAHLDPDLVFSAYPRQKDWKPVLGQHGSAQGHLRNQDVQAGDLFLFFGLFNDVERVGQRWQYVQGSRPRHVIWGWLSVGSVLNVVDLKEKQKAWLSYHPHLQSAEARNNCLYISSASTLGCLPGSGLFSYHDKLCLTDSKSSRPGIWCLPPWFYPDRRTPLSYHNKLTRWRLDENKCLLDCVARGQEFVLNLEAYPEGIAWARDLICEYAV